MEDFYSKIVKSLWTEPFVLIGFVFFMLGDEDNNYWLIGLTFFLLGYYQIKNRLRKNSFENNSPLEETNKLS